MTFDPQILAQLDRVEIERRLEFDQLPPGWYAVGAIVAVAVIGWTIIWMYRHEGRAGASRAMRWWLAALRCTAMAALAAIWLEPVLAEYRHRWIDSYTLVLVDNSSSMDLQDRYRDGEEVQRLEQVLEVDGRAPLRRTELVQRLLDRNQQALLRDLAASNRVKLYTFADETQVQFTLQSTREAPLPSTSDSRLDDGPVLAVGDKSLPTQFQAQGPATNLGHALRQACDMLGRSPLAGVVLLTDGGINQGDSTEVIARYARDKRIALHVVGIGDPSPPRNVRVADLIVPENVFAEDPFAVVAQLNAQGLMGEEITVELRERAFDAAGTERVIARQTVVLPPDGQALPVTFRHRQGAIGRYVYAVTVPVSEIESVADDNRTQGTVNVIENKLRTLLVAGAASWEYRYLSRLLQRDQTFELSCWLQSADEEAVRDGNLIIDHLPASAEELFAYDLVLLLDPDPLEFTAEFSSLIAQWVTDHGGGLLLAAARLHTGDFMRDPETRDLVRLLPVSVDPDADLVLNQLGHFQREPSPVFVPPSALAHPAMRLPSGATSTPGWNSIAEIYWHYPVLRAKPVASVLMEHGDPRMQNSYGPHVLFATHYVGAGRTAFLAFDGTWRWRAVAPEIFDRFWVQTLRYLVEGKLAGGNRRGTLLTEKDTYQLGEIVRVSARLFDASFKPLTDPEIEGRYRINDTETPFRLARIPDRPAWYEGSFVPPRTGGCTLSLRLASDLREVEVRREIQVVRPNLEIIEPQMRRERLVQLANQSAGGQYYEIDQLAALAKAIPDRHESTTIRSRPVPLWDDAWMLTLLLGLLTCEWALRKRARLL